VGNLSVGGTGKTPQIEYLIRLLSDNHKIATLSRGYKRQSKGFVLADATSNSATLGDEPFQYYQKFANIQVAVDADRRNGIQQLLSLNEKPEIILLDDAFQHRKVKAGFYILLTTFDDLYVDDLILPTGNLRESQSGAKRADIVIVTKCPNNLSTQEQEKIRKKLNLSSKQQLFFSCIAYDTFVYSEDKTLKVTEINEIEKLIVAGIAKPEPFFTYFQKEHDEVMVFPDHHHFSDADILNMKSKAKNGIIITTEKDYMRLKGSILGNQLFYLPIQSTFVEDAEKFNKTIINYVGSSSRNR
jgi:tetraacyldisaccharide 4'-kinase